MYYRKNGSIIRNTPQEPQVKEEIKPNEDIQESYSSCGGGFPIWALILIIVGLVLLGICLIWWIWASH